MWPWIKTLRTSLPVMALLCLLAWAGWKIWQTRDLRQERDQARQELIEHRRSAALAALAESKRSERIAQEIDLENQRQQDAIGRNAWKNAVARYGLCAGGVAAGERVRLPAADRAGSGETEGAAESGGTPDFERVAIDRATLERCADDAAAVIRFHAWRIAEGLETAEGE